MRTLKTTIAFVMTACMLLFLAACGEKGPDVTGKYLCVGESYFDEALQEPSEESWLELKKGGKGTYYSGFEFDLKWKLDGESFTGTVSFLGMEEPMEGTLKDGVIDVKYGDMNIRFVKEGAQAPADGGAAGGDTAGGDTAEKDGLAGYYTIYEAVIAGETMTYDDLEMAGMADGTYLNMFEDGFGELAFTDEIADSFTYDESTGLFTFNPGETLSFTVDGDYITVELPDQNMTLTFKLTDDQSSNAQSGEAVLAGSITDAFAGANTFVGVPDEVLTGDWFGWIRESECWGGHQEDFQAAWGFVNFDEGDDKYFEVYKDGDSQNAILSMWIKDEDTDTQIIPVIGDEDAWILSTYLTGEDARYFNTSIQYDGSLSFTYAYDDEGKSGCLIEIFLRKDGALWDEASDILPPRYEEYKAALAGNDPAGNQPGSAHE